MRPLWRAEPANVSRDFWMPDQSCRVCYECDSQFTVFNRRHHCRHCGRVFCAKCTTNSVPAPSSDPRTPREECEKIRVCNFCFKQWDQGVAILDNGIQVPSLDFSTPSSATSVVSPKSTETANSSCITLGSVSYPVGPYHRVPYKSSLSPRQSALTETSIDRQGVDMVASTRSNNPIASMGDPSPNQFGYCTNRSDDEDDEYGVYQLDSGTSHFPQANDFYSQVDFDEIDNDYGSRKVHPNGEDSNAKILSGSPLHHSSDSQGLEGNQRVEKKEDAHDIGDECDASSSLYAAEDVDSEPVDFENNGLLWLPPEPEDEEDEREALLFDDDDDGDVTGEWGYLQSSSSFGSGEYQHSPIITKFQILST